MQFLKKLPLLVGGGLLLCIALSLPQSSAARDMYDDDRDYQTRPRISDADLRSFEEYLDSHWQVADEPNDVTELEIERIGVLQNRLVRK